MDEVKNIMDAPRSLVSLDRIAGENETGSTIVDIIPDKKNSNTIDDAELRINIEDAYTAIDQYLDETTKFVVLERSKDPPTTWKELSSTMNISKGKLQVMEKEGLRRCALLLAIRKRIEV